MNAFTIYGILAKIEDEELAYSLYKLIETYDSRINCLESENYALRNIIDAAQENKSLLEQKVKRLELQLQKMVPK